MIPIIIIKHFYSKYIFSRDFWYSEKSIRYTSLSNPRFYNFIWIIFWIVIPLKIRDCSVWIHWIFSGNLNYDRINSWIKDILCLISLLKSDSNLISILRETYHKIIKSWKRINYLKPNFLFYILTKWCIL